MIGAVSYEVDVHTVLGVYDAIKLIGIVKYEAKKSTHRRARRYIYKECAKERRFPPDFSHKII